MTTLRKIIITRDNMEETDFDDLIQEARDMFIEGEDPDEILSDLFGLEPDYIFDLIAEMEKIA